MQDAWEIYLAQINDAAASVLVNLAFAERAPVEDFGHLLFLHLKMEIPGDHGMGLQEEADAAGPIADAAADHIQSALNADFVGRVRGGGAWQLYFYAREPDGFEAAAAAFMKQHAGRPYRVGEKPDPDWELFRTVLLPDDERMAWIKDRRVVDALRDHGDPLTEPRRVDHWLDVPDRAARDAVAARARDAGFAIESATSDPLRLQLSRTDHVDLDRIHTVVMELKALAADHGGTYDGWETAVLSG